MLFLQSEEKFVNQFENIQLGYPERCHNQLNCFQVHCSLLYFIIVYYTLKHLGYIPTTGYGFTLYYTIIYNHTWWWWWCGCGIHPSLNCLTLNSTGLVWVLTVLHCNLCILNTNSLNQAIPCQIQPNLTKHITFTGFTVLLCTALLVWCVVVWNNLATIEPPQSRLFNSGLYLNCTALLQASNQTVVWYNLSIRYSAYYHK